MLHLVTLMKEHCIYAVGSSVCTHNIVLGSSAHIQLPHSFVHHLFTVSVLLHFAVCYVFLQYFAYISNPLKCAFCPLGNETSGASPGCPPAFGVRPVRRAWHACSSPFWVHMPSGLGVGEFSSCPRAVEGADLVQAWVAYQSLDTVW